MVLFASLVGYHDRDLAPQNDEEFSLNRPLVHDDGTRRKRPDGRRFDEVPDLQWGDAAERGITAQESDALRELLLFGGEERLGPCISTTGDERCPEAGILGQAVDQCCPAVPLHAPVCAGAQRQLSTIAIGNPISSSMEEKPAKRTR